MTDADKKIRNRIIDLKQVYSTKEGKNILDWIMYEVLVIEGQAFFQTQGDGITLLMHGIGLDCMKAAGYKIKEELNKPIPEPEEEIVKKEMSI